MEGHDREGAWQEFHIHFISSFMLSVSSACTKSSISCMSEPPLKKGWRTLLKKKFFVGGVTKCPRMGKLTLSMC